MVLGMLEYFCCWGVILILGSDVSTGRLTVVVGRDTMKRESIGTMVIGVRVQISVVTC